MEETKELTLPEQARDQAKNYFRQGMNCTECVMQSFLDIHGSDLPPEVIALATVFGGGMGHTKNTCGAITGGVMALSAVVGRKHPLAKESMAERIAELNEIYDISGRMVHEMEEKFGTLICKELYADDWGLRGNRHEIHHGSRRKNGIKHRGNVLGAFPFFHLQGGNFGIPRDFMV